MKFFFALLSLLAAASARPNTKGLQDRIVLYPHLMKPGGKDAADLPYSRIVGGEEATPHEFPFIVALRIDDAYFCGGSIISADVVLTAAHCLDGAKSVKVIAGAHDQSNDDEQTQVVMISTDLAVHEGWNAITVDNDIAYARLPSPLEFNGNIAAIALATEEPAVGDDVTAAGWGKTKDGILQGVSKTLNKVTVPVGSDSDAEFIYGDSISWETKICIDTTGGRGTCQGDSGGPLFDETVRLVGATSFGASAGCQEGYPACFTAIPSFLDWIEKNTGVIA